MPDKIINACCIYHQPAVAQKSSGKHVFNVCKYGYMMLGAPRVTKSFDHHHPAKKVSFAWPLILSQLILNS